MRYSSVKRLLPLVSLCLPAGVEPEKSVHFIPVRRQATLEHEEQVRLERERRRAEGERRRASSPTRDPTVGKYASIIESRVGERERSGQESEGQ